MFTAQVDNFTIVVEETVIFSEEEAIERWDELLARVAAGKETVVSRRGIPIARMRPASDWPWEASVCEGAD